MNRSVIVVPHDRHWHVDRLLSEIQKIIRQTFPKNIELSIDLPKDLWMITADATMLHQVCMNLCVNARDPMPDGGTLP